MKKKKIIKSICFFLTLLAIIILTIWFLGRLVIPKYMEKVVEGALIAEYYIEEKNHDILFIGDCEVYENISPITLWEDYGLTSYIRGSAQQLIWQSYYLLEDSYRYEIPNVVVFNVLSMMYATPQNEAYNRMTLDGMRWSKSKINAIKASMTDEENFVEYVFPLFRYHSRWNELTKDDIKYLFHKDKISHNGYYMRVDIKPVTTQPRPRRLTNYQFSDTCYEYLDKIVSLCEEKGSKLVLMKAPSIYPHWYDEWDEQMVSYAKEHNLLYFNFLQYTDEIGIDYQLDTYDGGLHLNLSGAEKLSRYFGKTLASLCDSKKEPSEAVKLTWDEKCNFYYKEKARQESEEKQ